MPYIVNVIETPYVDEFSETHDTFSEALAALWSGLAEIGHMDCCDNYKNGNQFDVSVRLRGTYVSDDPDAPMIVSATYTEHADENNPNDEIIDIGSIKFVP